MHAHMQQYAFQVHNSRYSWGYLKPQHMLKGSVFPPIPRQVLKQTSLPGSFSNIVHPSAIFLDDKLRSRVQSRYFWGNIL